MAMTLAGTALADQLDDAKAAYGRGDYASALRLFRPLIDQGNAAAQFGLGAMYEFGNGVLQDYAEAVKWYRRAADQDDANGQLGVGLRTGAQMVCLGDGSFFRDGG